MNISLCCPQNSFRFLIVFFLFCGFCKFNFAQSGIGLEIGNVQSRFHVIDGAVNLTEYSKNFDYHGFKGAIYYSYNFNKYIGLKQSIGFIKRGAIIKRDVGYVSFEKYSIGYIDMSSAIIISPFNFFALSCGLNYNRQTKAILHWHSSQGRTSDSSSTFRKIDLGYNLGAILTIKNIFLKFSYFKSTHPIKVTNLVAVFDPEAKDTEYRNESIELTLGYHYDIPQKRK